MRILFAILLALLPAQLAAKASAPASGEAAAAQLFVAEDGVAPDASRLSGAIRVNLNDGWKTYWRSPGEVGLPPEIGHDASDNVAGVTLLYPAPARFVAFDIQNFGYGGEVTFPVEIALERPGEAAEIALSATLLVCADICIPETYDLTVSLPQGTGIDPVAAEIVGAAAATVPEATGAEARAHMGDALTVEMTSAAPLIAPDVFPEHGTSSFGPPEIRLADDGRTLWASLPVLSERGTGPVDVTVVDGARAVTVTADPAPAPIPAPGEASALLRIALLAFIGGLILNVMPCVLPVLVIKLTSATRVSGASLRQVRLEFLAAAVGVMSFVALLALGTWMARAMGLSVGWGMQFQSPVFLAFIVVALGLFAASLAGRFEIALPSGLTTALGRDRGGLPGAFGTGAFAALLATPCSAPFLGTAVAFALTGSGADIALVFAMLGLGLALPYLAVALRPSLVRLLPRPGAWMAWVRWIMAGMLALTALWFLAILSVSSGWAAALAVAVLTLVAVALTGTRAALLAPVAAIAALLLPLAMPAPDGARASEGWIPFDEAAIAARVVAGETVFVDVTADWCLTCKANKALVLDRGQVADALGERVVPMRADWTRPDETIRAYLEDHGRAGIPFNVVYGPGAPKGIALPELLTEGMVMEAIAAAEG